MKKVNKNLIIRPRNLMEGRAPYDKAIIKLGIEKCWPEKYSSIYHSDIVKTELKKIYNGKCAFCNQTPKGSPLQVEHFRPKNGLKDYVHTGYYWLGYEWTNLLYACGNCNSTKNNHFPLLRGVARVLNPRWISVDKFNLKESLSYSNSLKAEKYVLINPEIDNPEKHLYYESDGKIGFRDYRGEISIKRYNLNRDELYLEGRKQLLDDFLKKIAKRLQRFTDKLASAEQVYIEVVDVIIEDIVNPIQLNKSFDHFLYTIFHNYDLYIIPRFGLKNHQYLLNYIFSKLTQGLNVKLN
jgi:uncharacterized protein (TIGR02646 family)